MKSTEAPTGIDKKKKKVRVYICRYNMYTGTQREAAGRDDIVRQGREPLVSACTVEKITERNKEEKEERCDVCR